MRSLPFSVVTQFLTDGTYLAARPWLTSTLKSVMVVNNSNPITWEVEAGGSELKVILGYVIQIETLGKQT